MIHPPQSCSPRRPAFTLTEALVAVAIGLLVLGGIVTVFSAIRRMAHFGELAGTLQEAALAMAHIERDLSQAVQKPDPKVDSAVMVGKSYFQLLKAEFRPDGSIGGKLVVYQSVPSDAGNFRLRRRTGTDERTVPGLFRLIQFQQFKGPGGPFVRVTLRLAVHDSAQAAASTAGSEEAVLTGLVRVMGPEMLGSTAFSWSFMESLNLIDFLNNL